MNTNRQLIEQFLQFINTGDAAIGKPIISDDVIFYAPTSPEPILYSWDRMTDGTRRLHHWHLGSSP